VLLEIGATLDRYRLVEKIGEGGMGAVWRAEDTALGREVAVKVLSERLRDDREHLSRFEAEARALASLNHPNIVTIHGIEECAGERFLTMELVRGRRLDEIVPADGLPLLEFLRLAIGLTDAIAAAHRAGITHRDLKPGNVLVTDEGQVKVLDFGLALSRDPRGPATSDTDTTRTLSIDDRIAGTVPYMAPEQIQGREVDPRADVFALGVLMYEMATGHRPFGGATLPEAIASLLRDRPKPLESRRPEFPRHLGRVLARCLEQDPELRPASAAELRDELRAIARGLTAVGGTEQVSIAVLPFVDLSRGGDHEWLCAGIAEEILNALARVEGLRVASRTSSFQFRGVALDSREIADRLGVGALLEGSLRREGDRLRITAQLIHADGYHAWSERFDRGMSDVFAVQDEIAQAVVRALEVRLSPRERRAMRHAATDDVRAYEDYLRGRTFYGRYDRHGVRLAMQMFRHAIDRDPAFAAAWAGLADCCSYLYVNVAHDDALRVEAESASRTAVALDPDSPECRIARGQALGIDGRPEEARRQFEAAVRLAPGSFDAHYFYARTLFQSGALEEAAREFEIAAGRCSTDFQSPLLVAQVYESLGRPDAANEARRRGVAAVERRLEIEPDDVRALYMGANGLVALGERARGLDWARRARELDPDDTMLLYNLACIHALADEDDVALDCLTRAIDLGFANRGWLENDSNLDGLRDRPRFQDLLARL